MAKALALKLNEELKRFYDSVQQKGNIKMKEPRGTMLILDRGFDMIAPVVHDYYYQSLVYEFKEVGDEGEVTVQDNKMAFLNDQDDLWVRYRNQHIVEVNNSLNQAPCLSVRPCCHGAWPAVIVMKPPKLSMSR